MSTPYTPGPWIVDEDMRQNMEWNRHIYGSDGMCVCFMSHSDGKNPSRDAANANLIAAAPDLLAALEFLVEREWQDDEGEPKLTEAREKAKAAIKKARGES